MDWLVVECLMIFHVGIASLFCLRLKVDIVLVSNGAVFMPNTFEGQQWVRTNYDNYVESLEEGKSTSDAIILSVGKGTRFLDDDMKAVI